MTDPTKPFEAAVQVEVRFEKQTGRVHVRVFSAIDDWSAMVPYDVDPFDLAKVLLRSKFPEVSRNDYE